MSRTLRRKHMDLFDDPSWDSQEAREDAAAYGRLVVSGFSARTETAVVIFWIGLFFLFIATAALFLWVATNTVDNLFSHMFDHLVGG